MKKDSFLTDWLIVSVTLLAYIILHESIHVIIAIVCVDQATIYLKPTQYLLIALVTVRCDMLPLWANALTSFLPIIITIVAIKYIKIEQVRVALIARIIMEIFLSFLVDTDIRTFLMEIVQ